MAELLIPGSGGSGGNGVIVTETANWGQWFGNPVVVPSGMNTRMTWDTLESGDASVLDVSTLDLPVIPSDGIYAVSAWVGCLSSAPCDAYLELIATAVGGVGVVGDLGINWRLESTAFGAQPSTSLTLVPVYMNAGTTITVRVEHDLGTDLTFALYGASVTKLSEAA